MHPTVSSPLRSSETCARLYCSLCPRFGSIICHLEQLNRLVVIGACRAAVSESAWWHFTRLVIVSVLDKPPTTSRKPLPEKRGSNRVPSGLYGVGALVDDQPRVRLGSAVTWEWPRPVTRRVPVERRRARDVDDGVT